MNKRKQANKSTERTPTDEKMTGEAEEGNERRDDRKRAGEKTGEKADKKEGY